MDQNKLFYLFIKLIKWLLLLSISTFLLSPLALRVTFNLIDFICETLNRILGL